MRGPSEGREGTPQETDAQRRKREDVLLANAAAVRSVRATLSLAFQRPNPEPARPPTGHDYMLQEMRWLAVDFGQVCRHFGRSRSQKLAINPALSCGPCSHVTSTSKSV